MDTFYKALGFITWQVAKWYLRKKAPDRTRLLIGGAAAGVLLLAAGGAVASRSGEDTATV